jgi:16S rRNA processing protein RimM
MSIVANFPLGFVKKSRGLKGELLISLISSNIEFEKRLRTVWLGDSSNHLHPWKVEYLHIQGSSAFLKLNDVNSREEADYLRGINIFIPDSWITYDSPVQFIGYQVYSEPDHEYIGEVQEVDNSDPQKRLIVKTESGEIIIPLVDEFIRLIDTRKRQIQVILIDGLDQ